MPQGIRLTPAVKWILILTVGAFLLQLLGDTFFGTQIFETLALVPSQVFARHHYWQLVTYTLMHADMFHILFNMLILVLMGAELESRWGTKFFVRYYLICAASAGLFYMAVQFFFKGTAANYIPLVGSSGAIYGLLTAYGIIYSERTLLFMMIFPMKAKHFTLLLAAIEFISTVFYSRNGVANAAHLGGILTGFVYLFFSAYFRVRKKQGSKASGKKLFRKNHLRLVVNNEVIKEFEGDEEDHDDRPTFH